MASNKAGIDNLPGGSGPSLGGALLRILAGGIAGGVILISGAKALGDALLDKQASDERKLEEQREADKEAVRRIMENEVE